MLFTKRSDQQLTGRYVQGGTNTISYGRLGWWERIIFPKDNSDVKITLTSKYHKRPDLLAFDIYGSATLGWFILQYNTIVDIPEEFVQGTVVLLPTKSRLTELLSKKPGSPF